MLATAIFIVGLMAPPQPIEGPAATVQISVVTAEPLESAQVAPHNGILMPAAAGLQASDQRATEDQHPAQGQQTAESQQTGGDQQTAEDKKPPTPPHTGVHALLDGLKEDLQHLPSSPNIYLAGVGGAIALGTHPFDSTFNARLRSHYDAVNAAFAPAKYYGDTPEQVALSLGTYAFGRIFDKPKVSHLGMDLLRAQAITEILVEPLKFATHRERPDASNHQSFPSGHAAITFAGATVIERHLGWKKSVLGYAIASYVAASRLHDNRHYLSDVVFGAAVGTIAGRTVTEHGREMWTFAPTPVAGGIAIVASRQSPR